MLCGLRKSISFKSRRMPSLRLIVVSPLAKSPVVLPSPALYPPHRGKQACPSACWPALRHRRCSFASIPGWSSSPRRAGNKGLFPPSAGFLRFPARFLCFASCFVLFRFLSPALLGFFVSCLFYFYSFTYQSCLEAGLLPPQLLVQTKRCCLHWQYFLPSIRGRWSPVTYT